MLGDSAVPAAGGFGAAAEESLGLLEAQKTPESLNVCSGIKRRGGILDKDRDLLRRKRKKKIVSRAGVGQWGRKATAGEFEIFRREGGAMPHSRWKRNSAVRRQIAREHSKEGKQRSRREKRLRKGIERGPVVRQQHGWRRGREGGQGEENADRKEESCRGRPEGGSQRTGIKREGAKKGRSVKAHKARPKSIWAGRQGVKAAITEGEGPQDRRSSPYTIVKKI